MGILYLVRHGQASFGADDYDRLSPLGQQQSERLGRYWRERGRGFEAVYTGTLRRHAQTWSGIAAGGGYAHVPQALPELNEYDSAALIAAIHPQPLPRPDTSDLYRQHFRLLRQALQAWMQGQISPRGMPAYAEFAAGVQAVLQRLRQQHEGDVLIVSSGGPIATAVGSVLQAPPAATIELNMRLRNSAVTEFQHSPKRHSLLCFNAVPHLDSPGLESWITYA
jgi:broad specificity phosphatase PhoE